MRGITSGSRIVATMRMQVARAVGGPALRNEMAKLHELADLDGLTRLPNRRVGTQAVATALSDFSAPTGVAMFDIDHFKSINDRFGHRAGDEALKGVANVLAEAAKQHGGTASRLGGEEFALVLPGRNTAQTERVAEDVLKGVRALRIPTVEGDVITLTSSAGVTSASANHGLAHMHVTIGESGVSDALAAADGFLYKAKQTTRDRVVSDATKL